MRLCNRVQQLFSAYYEGELSADQRTAFEQHLAECRLCRENFAAFRFVCGRLKSLPKAKPSPYFDAALLYRLRRERQADRRQSLWPLSSWRPVPIVVVAAALLIFIGAQLQKAAMDKQLRELTTLAELVRQTAGTSHHFVVTQIDTAANRLRVIKYVNMRPATVLWETNAFQLGRQESSPGGGALDYPDLRQAQRSGGSVLSPRLPNMNGAHVIQASQYQF